MMAMYKRKVVSGAHYKTAGGAGEQTHRESTADSHGTNGEGKIIWLELTRQFSS